MDLYRPGRTVAASIAASIALTGSVGLTTLPAPAASAVGPPTGTSAVERPAPAKQATARGRGGAVTSVDPDASRVGLRVLRRGGNAVDAAVATAAALGVTEPYSAGVGGGGYFVTYQAATGRVGVIDGRETAPKRMPQDAFVDPSTEEPYPFTPDLVTSGVSVGTPGTPATWSKALRRWGSLDLGRALAPATRLAERGFVVDDTFASQTDDNAERFAAFTTTSDLFLPGGEVPAVGSVFRNPDLADTYRRLAAGGDRFFYTGALPRQISEVVRRPPTTEDTDLPVPPGFLRPRDFADYRALVGPATRSTYRGLDVHGMPPSSSGGTTVGEALNVLEALDDTLGEPADDTAVLHRYLEASALAFADRAAYVGDDAFVDVPARDLLSDAFAAERACQVDPDEALVKPVAAGDVASYDGVCDEAARDTAAPDTEGVSTTHLTVADRDGNVVSYTLTIEQTGGSGIVVPGRGFLLNNELTDFTAEYDPEDPNRIQPGKRPRSSMSPTILTRDGRPVLALGSPGGSTIITTVLQTLVNRYERGMGLPASLAEPRASQRNTAAVSAEPVFIDAYGEALEGYGHTLAPAGDAFTSAAEIGALTAIGIGPRGRLTAVAEPVRRGGGDARVVRPVAATVDR